MSTHPFTAAVPHSLSPEQIRVLGCLMEKQRTTPDAYPLSLNALRLACNQSTNREPVVEYDETLLRDALHRLERHGLTRLASGAGSRAPKYRHLLAEKLPLSAAEHAVLCVLMLRGPQTPGELKQRTERMHAFSELDQVHATLDGLIVRELVLRLERRPGQKEERFEQLLGEGGGESHTGSPAVAAEVHVQSASEPADDVALRERVAKLECEMAELRAAVQSAGIGDWWQ